MSKEQLKTLDHWKAFLDNAQPDEKLNVLMQDPVFKPKKRITKLREKLEVAKNMKQKAAEKKAQQQQEAEFGNRAMGS